MPELVALQTMLPQIESPLQAQGKALQLRQLMGASQDADYERQMRAQAAQDDASYRQALQANPKGGEGLLSALAGSGNVKGYAAAQKADLDARKASSDIGKTDVETKAKQLDTLIKANGLIGSAAGALKANPTFDNATAIVGQLRQSVGPELAAQMGLDNLEIPRDPAAITQWAQQHYLAAVDADKQLADARTAFEGNANRGVQVENSKRSAASSKYSADSSAGTARARLNFDKSQAEGDAPTDLSESSVDAIGQGRMKAPTGYALRNPKMANLMDRVNQKYPGFDATEYDAKQKAMRDFSTGTPGNSIRSFATATEHLKQLNGLVDALDNGNIPLINKAANIVAQNTGSVAPTNFDAAKGIVAKEVLKSIVAGGGGVEERQELSHLLDNAKTTKQLKGVIESYSHLMEAQKDKLERQYELSTGRKDAKTRFAYKTDDAATSAKPGGVVNFGDLK